jgi:hypothetical protein
MAQKIEQFSRILHHRLTSQGTQFTIPTSNDHTDETWSSTDLYIGEIGINVTDDTIFMRTNNGIVQIATGTVSGVSGTASPSVWTFTGTNIEIGATYTANAVQPRSGQYTDLGSSSLRWKDLYLGGSVTGFSSISANLGLEIKDSTGNILTTANFGLGIQPFQLATQSSTAFKTRPLHIQTQSSNINGFGTERVLMASSLCEINEGNRVAIIGGQNVGLSSSLIETVYLGQGYDSSRYYSYNQSVGVGGRLVLRGVDDDGSTQYNESEWVTGQERLTTSNALTTPIFSLGFTSSYSEAIMIKAYVMGVDTSDSSLVHSNEILFTTSWSGTTASIIPDPIVNEIDSFADGVEVIASTDTSAVEISVKGTSTNTIQWLCTYSYQRIINI